MYARRPKTILMDDTTNQTTNDTNVFQLPMEDADILTLLKKPVSESESYWDKEKNLKAVREKNMNLWLPNHWKNKDVYDYQESYLYQDNRIFTSVETICSVINSRIPSPEVMPAQDTQTSQQLAKDLQDTLYAWAKKYNLSDIFRINSRNLLLKRVGITKLRWDPVIKDIIPEWVEPDDLVLDSDAEWGKAPRFIGQKIRNKTAQELVEMYPDAQQKIYKMIGVNRSNKAGDLVAQSSQLGKKKMVYELWFQYYDEQKEQYSSGTVVVDENFQYVLNKDKNPNWNYQEESKGGVSNLLDYPMPPYIPMNYLNDGSSWIDLTTMVEQAAPLQAVLDYRGFQIMENSEQSSGGRIYNTQMIKKEDIAKLTGSPDESVGVNGDVRAAVVRDAPAPLANYVLEDKQDARDEIDNIFATHDISRGQQSNNKTLGQDQLQQGQDYTRMDDIARAVARHARAVYQYAAQMMKVYYTEEHWFKAKGEDGQFDYVVMKSDKIEDGIDVTVEEGSNLPVNKQNQLQAVKDLATTGLVDPLTLYEVVSGAPMPSPKKMLERFMAYKINPQEFAQGASDDDIDRKAFEDIQILNRGQMPKVRDSIDQKYLDYMNKYMTGGDFQGLDDKVKVMYGEWMAICQAQAQKQLEAMMSQAPTPMDGQMQNQQAAQQAAVEQQLMQNGGGQSAPGQADPAALAGQMAQGAPS